MYTNTNARALWLFLLIKLHCFVAFSSSLRKLPKISLFIAVVLARTTKKCTCVRVWKTFSLINYTISRRFRSRRSDLFNTIEISNKFLFIVNIGTQDKNNKNR